jgi:hypothetical protein
VNALVVVNPRLQAVTTGMKFKLRFRIVVVVAVEMTPVVLCQVEKSPFG